MVFNLLGIGLTKLMENDENLKKAQDAEKMSKKDFVKKWGEVHIISAGMISSIKVPMGDYYDQIQRFNGYGKKRCDDALKLSKENSNVKSFLDNKEIIREIYIPGKLVNFVIK